jgi:hypothetical protein
MGRLPKELFENLHHKVSFFIPVTRSMILGLLSFDVLVTHKILKMHITVMSVLNKMATVLTNKQTKCLEMA